ncbi:MAG TPA: hypothetical protein PKK56_00355 [archaeon]|nr:hypothetical protein [archaeon]
MINTILLYLISIIFATFICILITPNFISLMKQRGFVGKDMNKLHKPLVAELGGIPVFVSFVLSSFFCILFSLNIIDYSLFLLLILMMTIIFIIGILDDALGWKKGINQWQHFILPLLFSIPVIIYAISQNFNSIYIPFLGTLNVGYIYAIILVPIAITATTNAFNLLAGFNGMEAGMSIIIFITISIFALFKGNITLLLILGAWIGALIGIYKYNKYPAKIFLGDGVTLVSGVLIGMSAIVLKLEWLIAFIYILYIIEFIIKASHNFKPECFGVPQKDGTLAPKPTGGSLTHIVMKKGRFTEKQVVHIFYILQTIICGIALIFFFF